MFKKVGALKTAVVSSLIVSFGSFADTTTSSSSSVDLSSLTSGINLSDVETAVLAGGGLLIGYNVMKAGVLQVVSLFKRV